MPDSPPLPPESEKRVSETLTTDLNGNATVSGIVNWSADPSAISVEMPPSTPIEGKSRRVVMRPVQIVELCDCGADLPAPRQGMTTGWRTDWQHWCATCQKSVWRVNASQRIEYEPIRRRTPPDRSQP